MNIVIDRQLVAQILIMLAICIGGWMVIVEPKLNEINKLEATITEATTNPMLTAQRSVEDMADELQSVRDRLVWIEAQNNFAGDSSQIYGLVMDLAEKHSITVQRLDPGSDRDADDEEKTVRVMSFNMLVRGKYIQVAEFMRALEDLSAFICPMTVRLAPAEIDGRMVVEAHIDCEAVSFTMPDELAAMTGASNAE